MKALKNAISILLVICFVFSSVPAAFSASSGTVDIGDAEAVYGQSVSVPVTLSANAGVWGMRFFVYYPKALTLTSASSNGVFAAFEHSNYNVVPSLMPYEGDFFTSNGVDDDAYYACCLIFENFDEDTYLDYYGIEPSAQNAGGTIGALTFTAPQTEGIYEIKILPFEAIDELADDVVLDYTSGTITVGECFHKNGYEWALTTAPTCTDEGEETYVCVDCRKGTQTRPVSATGHTPDADWTVTSDAVCTTAGEKVKYCLKCGEVVETEVITAKGHKAGEREIVKAATCTENGSYEIKCTVCSEVLESGTIPAKGHHFSNVYTIDVQPDDTTPGEKSRHCLDCDARTDITAIYDILLGDANDDGFVSIKDSLAMKKHLLNPSYTVNFRNSDIDKDGYITLKDRKYLIKYLITIITDLNEVAPSQK